MWPRARGEEAEYRIAGRHSVTLENLASFFQVIFEKNHTLWLFCFESLKNCIANIFLCVKCRLCTRADSRVSFYILEVMLLVTSKYKKMQENYKRWTIIQKEMQFHVGRNTKPCRKKYKTPQEEIQNTTGRNTKPCWKKHKTMQEDFQNHTRKNAKPCKKKYKTMPEEILNHARRNTKYRGSTSSSRRAGPRGL